MPDSKFWLRSKTVLFNLGCALFYLAVMVVNAQFNGTGGISPTDLILPPEWAEYGAMFVIAGNVVIRFMTNKGITLKRNADGGSPPPAEAAVDGESPYYFRRAGMFLIPLVSCYALGSLACAQDAPYSGPPRAVINGPSGAVPGDEVVLDFHESLGDIFDVEVTRRGFSMDETHYEIASDRRAVEIRTYPGTYDVTLTVANSLCPDMGVDRKRYTVAVWATYPLPPAPPQPLPPAPPTPPVPGPTPPNPPAPEPPSPPAPVPPQPPAPPQPEPPQPPVPPAPPTPPEPNLPEGKFGVSKRVYELAMSVDSTDRSAEAKRIAGVMQRVADRIEDGKTRGNDAIRAELMSGFGEALDADASARWRSPFGLALAELIVELLLGGKLGSWENWVELLKEIIAALMVV